MSSIKELTPINPSCGFQHGQVVRADWQTRTPPPHEFVALACPEEEGGFSVFALNYPGVISQGETIEEAKQNIAEAFLAVLESRRKHGERMEYSRYPTVEVLAGCQQFRVTIDG